MRAIDLFCGTGGFTRGAITAGFEVAAAFDIDRNLTFSHHHNFPGVKLHRKDVSTLTGEWIADKVGDVDLVYGGPPCQGFSSIGKRDANDERRTLLQHFFRIVAEVRPAAFVMENVEGLLYADAKPELDAGLALVSNYAIIGPDIIDAADFGAATKRRRAFVIGYDPDRCAPLAWRDFKALIKSPATIEDALCGLDQPIYRKDYRGFDIWNLSQHDPSQYAAGLICRNRQFTGNRRTKHSDPVVERFSKVIPGSIDRVGRHPRLAWDGQCPTLRAGTGADHGSHQSLRPIHPSENRVITVREAARIQGFPDKHRFHPTIWHSFRQIGNSVSPMVSTAVLSLLHERLERGALSEAA